MRKFLLFILALLLVATVSFFTVRHVRAAAAAPLLDTCTCSTTIQSTQGNPLSGVKFFVKVHSSVIAGQLVQPASFNTSTDSAGIARIKIVQGARVTISGEHPSFAVPTTVAWPATPTCNLLTLAGSNQSTPAVFGPVTSTDNAIARFDGATGALLQNSTVTLSDAGVISAIVLTNATGLPLTTGVTGTLPVANGGTGSVTQNFVDLTTGQSIAGNKTFSGNLLAGDVNTILYVGARYPTIQAAHDALPATGGTIVVPGTIVVTGATTITKPNVTVRGLGIRATTVTTSSTTADVFTVTGSTFTLRDLRIDGPASKTAGSFVNLNGVQLATVEDVQTDLGFISVLIQGAGGQTFVNRGDFREGAVNGSYIKVTGGGEVHVDNTVIDGGSQPEAKAGIEIQNVGGIYINNTDILHAGDGVLINPGSGQSVDFLFSGGGLTLDSNSQNGISVTPSGTGVARSMYIAGGWTGSNLLHGVVVSTGGTINGLHLTDHRSVNNGRHGVYLAGGVNTAILGGTISGNSFGSPGTYDGVHVDAGVSNFSVIGANIGQFDTFGTSQGYGGKIDVGGSNNYRIIGCDLTGNTTGALSNGATGANREVRSNLGAEEAGTAWTAYSPTVTTGTGTITTLGTVTGRYKQIGQVVFVQVIIPITTNGTGAGSVNATLPIVSKTFDYILSGREVALNGTMLYGHIRAGVPTDMLIRNYDNSYPGADGMTLVISGSYEAN